LPIHSNISGGSGGGVKAWPRGPLGCVPARAAPQGGCVGRHLANVNEMRVSGSDSYALLFLFHLLPILSRKYRSHLYFWQVRWAAVCGKLIGLISATHVCVMHVDCSRWVRGEFTQQIITARSLDAGCSVCTDVGWKCGRDRETERGPTLTECVRSTSHSLSLSGRLGKHTAGESVRCTFIWSPMHTADATQLDSCVAVASRRRVYCIERDVSNKIDEDYWQTLAIIIFIRHP